MIIKKANGQIVQVEPQIEMPVKPQMMQNGRVPAYVNQYVNMPATGPTAGEQLNSQSPAQLNFVSYRLQNANTTGDALQLLLFDAYGAYTEANNYTVPSNTSVTANNILNSYYKNFLETGYRYHCNMIDLEILVPTDDNTQLAQNLLPFTHGVSKLNSIPLTPIIPSIDTKATDFQSNIKNLPVDFVIDAGLAITVLVNPGTTINLGFHISLITS